MCREHDITVGGGKLEFVEVGWTAARRRLDAATFRGSRLRVVVSEQRTAAGISEHHNILESFLIAQKPDSRGEVEDEIFVQHHRVVVQIAGVETECGESRIDPKWNRVMGTEVGAGMRHDHNRARLALGGRVKNAARFSEVGGIEMYWPLADGGIDIAEIDRITRLVIAWCLGHSSHLTHSSAEKSILTPPRIFS